MSCEVLCCDISDILDTLCEADDGKLLDKLFSLLQVDPPLDCRLAGYFEKVHSCTFKTFAKYSACLKGCGAAAPTENIECSDLSQSTRNGIVHAILTTSGFLFHHGTS